MYTAREIADFILGKINFQAGDTISPLKLQKLLYYCQAWHLTIFNKPLFEEKIEAWAHGPVIPSQYSRFCHVPMYDRIKVSNMNLEIPNFTPDTESLLIEVLELYGEHSASYLENLTHNEKPWIDARKGIPLYAKSNEEISHEAMTDFYSSMKN